MSVSGNLEKAVKLLQEMVRRPSFSREEGVTADLLEDWLRVNGAVDVRRLHNNVYAVAPGYDPSRPTLMLNSHHDTVRPARGYTRDPFSANLEDGCVFGLGSNDAGASVVSLACTFLALQHDAALPVNLLLALTAAEEVMGEFGMRAFLPHLATEGLAPDMVIVGEPTGMQPAVAERGLVVLDAEVTGKSGHASLALATRASRPRWPLPAWA